MINIKDISHTPTLSEINQYVQIPLFNEVCDYMNSEYHAICKIEYSKDSLLRGWNVKFRKSGKALCVIYPKPKYFTILVVIGRKEKEEVENQLPHLSTPIQELYKNTNEGMGQRWLMIDVQANDCVYQDTLKLIAIRFKNR